SSGIPTYFVLQNPWPVGGGSIDRLKCGQFGANSSETCGFLPQRFKRHALAKRRHREDAITPPPAITGRRTIAASREQASYKNKARLVRPGSSLVSYAEYDALFRRRDFPELALERLIGLPGEVGIKLAQLGRLRHEGLIRALGIVGLHLDRL